jgi:hypothetical protein
MNLEGFYFIIIMEIFKKIPGFEDYEVSNLGNVKSLYRFFKDKTGRNTSKKERILKNSIDTNGYCRVNLSNKGEKRKTFQVHQLVAIAFLDHKPNGFKGLVVDHIDNNPLNNNVENLQLITNRENSSKDKKGYSSKYIGVNWYKRDKKWRAQIMINGKLNHLGCFKNEKIAHAVYLNAVEGL